MADSTARGVRRPTTVLMISPTAVEGGSEAVLTNLATCLPALGITPVVLCLEDGPLVPRLRATGAAVHVVKAGRLRQPRGVARAARVIGSLARRERADLIVSNLPKAHLYAWLPAVIARRPTLWIQGNFPEPPHWIDRLATLAPSGGALAESRDAVAAQRRLRPRRPVHLFHLGIDVNRFAVSRDPALRSEHDIPAGVPLVSLVGRLQPWKGQREFLQAAALLLPDRPDTRFAVVGGAILGREGDYPDELRRLAARLGIEERVLFTGHTGEVTRWMAASDVIVNASQTEPFGLVVVEAMASGCTTVAVSSGGPRDVIEHLENGILCPSNAPEDLARGIALAIDDDDLRARIGPAARLRVERSFSRERMTERFAEIVDATLSA